MLLQKMSLETPDIFVLLAPPIYQIPSDTEKWGADVSLYTSIWVCIWWLPESSDQTLIKMALCMLLIYSENVL